MPSSFQHDPSFTVAASNTTAGAAVKWVAAKNIGESLIILDSGGNGRIGLAGDLDLITLTANTVTVAGTVAATTLTGAGAGITALNADNIGSGTVPVARLGDGNESNSTFLRGDNTWVAAGGDLSFGGDTFGADKVIGSTDPYSLSFETAGVVRMKIHGPVTNPTSAGAITMPTQPAFYAINASTDDNQTGYNTEATIEFSDTETNCFDQGGDFASNTFTAPITGQYVFFAHMEIRGLSVAASLAQMRIKRNSGGTPYTQLDPQGSGYGGSMGMHLSSMMHLVAGDTVTVTLVGTYESTNAWDINGQTATHTTAFSGFLVA